MTRIVFLNGEYLPNDKAKISVLDRGFLYGDGIFETIRVYRGAPFRWREHLDRMRNSANSLGIKYDPDPAALRVIVDELLKQNNLQDAYLRINLSRGIYSGKIGFEASGEPTLFIYADTLNPPKEDEYENGVGAIIMPQSYVSPLAAHKTIAYLPYLLAREKAIKAGAREAFLSAPSGRITEGATSNIFIVLEGSIFTPPTDGSILAGIARRVVIDALAENNIRCLEDYFIRSDLTDADEIFITNSMIEVLPITSLDGKKILGGKPGPMARKALQVYREKVTKEIESENK